MSAMRTVDCNNLRGDLACARRLLEKCLPSRLRTGSPSVLNFPQLLTKKKHPLRQGCDTIAANRGAYAPPGWAPVLTPYGPGWNLSSEPLLLGSAPEPGNETAQYFAHLRDRRSSHERRFHPAGRRIGPDHRQ